VLVKNLHQAEDAYAGAIVPNGVAGYIGHVRRAESAAQSLTEIEVFDVRADPQGDARPVRPFHRTPSDNRRIIVSGVFHGEAHTGSYTFTISTPLGLQVAVQGRRAVLTSDALALIAPKKRARHNRNESHSPDVSIVFGVVHCSMRSPFERE